MKVTREANLIPRLQYLVKFLDEVKIPDFLSEVISLIITKFSIFSNQISNAYF